MDRERFVAETLAWIHHRLLPPDVSVDADTALFENGLVDSIRILKLIAWTESRIGRTIPDREIRMDNFRSVRRIAAVFAGEESP